MNILVFIDTHCHLTAPEYADDIADVLAKARLVNVQNILCIADDYASSKAGIALCEHYSHVYATVGIHPHKANECTEYSVSDLRLLAAKECVVAIGEIGLDYHYNFCDKSTQKKALYNQIVLANTLDLPIVLHNRDSWDDLWTMVQELRPKKAVLHCCTEPWEHVKQWLHAGYMVSFTGIATFPAATVVHEVIVRTPLNRMMIETDGPYLAPVPYRGKRNEPQYIPQIASAIAVIKGISLEEVALQTTKNAQEFFCMKI